VERGLVAITDEDLAKLATLLDEEFTAAKAKLLG
jgi:hypothetical protein